MESPVSVIANTINIVTIITCFFMKIPQIMYIRQKQSAEGLYIPAMLMEITGFSIVTLYNFTNHYSMMTYLEYPIILLQVYVMLFYALKYNKMLGSPIVPFAVMVYVTGVMMFLINVLPQQYLSYMLPFCTPMSGFAKVTYIYGIIKAANADSVSLITWMISIFTNVSRLFTVYVDSADKTLMINFVISALLSTGVLTAALYYQLKSGAKKNRGRRASSRRDRGYSQDRKHERDRSNNEHDD